MLKKSGRRSSFLSGRGGWLNPNPAFNRALSVRFQILKDLCLQQFPEADGCVLTFSVPWPSFHP